MNSFPTMDSTTGVPEIINLLEAGAPIERIADYLSFVEGVTMGVQTERERTAVSRAI